MAKKKSDKQTSGGKRLTDSGKRPVLLGLTQEQHDTVRAAAEADGRPVTQFLIFHGLKAAQEILKKQADQS